MSHSPMARLRLAGLPLLAAVLGLSGAVSPSSGGPAAASGPTIRHAGSPTAVAGSYLVVLENGAAATGAADVARSLAARYHGRIGQIYSSALHGFSVRLTAAQALRLAASPEVAYVEQDQVVRPFATQPNPPSWGLDRIDQRNLPLDNSYTYTTTAANVHVYVIDTGIRITHQDFGGRASYGRDVIDNDNIADDCNGHGTHAAGVAGGTAHGVAKGVQLVAVRALSCAGSATTAQVVAGIDWVTANAVTPAVANLAIGGGISTALDTAVTNSINSGVTYSVVAGASNSDACNFSPARVPAAITTGATDINDQRASFSNFGPCLDLFAPGVGITSTAHTSDTATVTLSGTSMATAHVTGAAALILADHPTFTPQQVRDTMVANATPGVVGNPGPGSPNLLLYTLFGAAPVTVFFDNFETNLGWTTNPTGTDTATTGQWQRGDPQQTSSGGTVYQLGTTVSGINDLVTGAAAGSGVSAFDIDGGLTSIRSPAIALPTGTLTLSFSWYLAHRTNASSADFLRVKVVGSTTSTMFQQLGAATNRGGVWRTASVNVSGFGGQTVRLLIEAADAGGASLVEAAVDDVKITKT